MAYHPWHDVELPPDLEEPIPAVIEIPMGSKVKYELDKVSGLLMVDRILFSAVYYPANYGFVPRTFCEDGDPLDILVFCREPIASLALMRANVIGVMKMRDEKGEDDKLIAVHADDPEYASYSDLWQLPPHRLRELKRFFEDYKALERKAVMVSDPLGRREALGVLRDAIHLYHQKRTELLERYSAEPPAPPPPLDDGDHTPVMPGLDEGAAPKASRKKKAASPPPIAGRKPGARRTPAKKR
ncbi:MAG TPA: inorganic diphosphatase [Vulgatibacter sp.]